METINLGDAAAIMQELTATLLVHGILLAIYGSPLLVYLILRRKTQGNSAGRSIKRWKLLRQYLCGKFLVTAVIWIVAIPYMFGHLIFSLDQICPSLVAPYACSPAMQGWQATCVALIECACALFIIILWVVYARGSRTESLLERELSYRLALLDCSHCLFVVSWLMCIPLVYSRNAFSPVRSRYWDALCAFYAVSAITAYITGICLWIIAPVLAFRVWRRTWRNWTPAEAQWPGASDRDIALQEL